MTATIRHAIKTFFKGSEMDSTQGNEGELTHRLAEIERDITTGSGDVLDLLTEKELVKKQILAASIASGKRQDKEYRARVTAEAAERQERVNAAVDELADLIPRVQIACSMFTRVADEVQARGLGFNTAGTVEELLGLPQDFGTRVIAEITAAAPNVSWDVSHLGFLGQGRKAERPAPITRILKTPAFRQDFAAPPGFSGAWDPLRGRPLQDEPVEGPAASFPPSEAPE